MDMDQAIMAHVSWKQRFRDHLDGKLKLDAAIVQRPDLCELGEWLVEEEKRYQAMPEFGVVKQRHAEFHKMAAEVLRTSVGQSHEQAAKLIAWNSAYGTATSACVSALVSLRDKLKMRH